MSRQKKYSILSLAVVFLAALVAAFTLLFGVISADAERMIYLTGSQYFYTANNAEIGEQEVDGTYYTTFLFTEEDSAITYRKNLAYHWYASVKDENGDATDEVEEGYLYTTIGFTTIEEGDNADKLPFETFTIKFQSQQYSETKDGVTTNYIVFIANESGNGVYVVIGDEDVAGYTYADISGEIGDYTLLTGYDQITISFSDYASGEYLITVTDDSGNEQKGCFTNVAGSYAKYVSSSSSTSVIPLTYSATFASYNTSGSGDDDSDSAAVGMILYDFNGQEFALKEDSSGDYYVPDSVAPVLCLNEVVTTLRYGYTIDIDYAVIDMLATSPTSTLYYYVLTNAQLEVEDYNFEDTTNEEFIKSSSSSDPIVIREKDAYTGKDDDGNTDALAYVKIYFSIQDTSSGTSDIVFLDWYVDSDYLAQITGATCTANFLKAVSDEEGATYTYTDSNGNTPSSYTDIVSEITEEYQKMVDEALEEQEASAGDGNYFYLPSFEDFVTDNYADYTSLNFSIYYISSSSGSSTSLAYNELALEIETAGYYKFAIYVTDEEDNEMWYLNEKGETVKIYADDIADLLQYPTSSALNGIVPVFEFRVYYVGLSIEDPGAQDIAYVDSEYTASSFDITGLSSNYTTSYKLYVFNLADFVDEIMGGDMITYATFIAQVEKLFTNTAYFNYDGAIYYYDDLAAKLVADGAASDTAEAEEIIDIVVNNYINNEDEYEGDLDLNEVAQIIKEHSISGINTRAYFSSVKAYSELAETDSDYDDYADYEWDPSSLSFVPQDDNTFYVIVLTASDGVYAKKSSTQSYMCISVSAAAESLAGESEWLQNNIASVVLLCVAGAALIGIVLLIVIKPREKGDIDIIDENEEKKSKSGRKGKKAK